MSHYPPVLNPIKIDLSVAKALTNRDKNKIYISNQQNMNAKTHKYYIRLIGHFDDCNEFEYSYIVHEAGTHHEAMQIAENMADSCGIVGIRNVQSSRLKWVDGANISLLGARIVHTPI